MSAWLPAWRRLTAESQRCCTAPPGGLGPHEIAMLRDYQPARVVLVGGIAVLPASVEDTIETEAPGAQVTRISGDESSAHGRARSSRCARQSDSGAGGRLVLRAGTRPTAASTTSTAMVALRIPTGEALHRIGTKRRGASGRFAIRAEAQSAWYCR